VKPRLTTAVMRGLQLLASHAEAGGPADILGNDGPEDMKRWNDVKRAVEWVGQMDEDRGQRQRRREHIRHARESNR
jgi:hypothetical protein